MDFINVLYCEDGEYYVTTYALDGNELKVIDYVYVDVIDPSCCHCMQTFVEDTYLFGEVM